MKTQVTRKSRLLQPGGSIFHPSGRVQYTFKAEHKSWLYCASDEEFRDEFLVDVFEGHHEVDLRLTGPIYLRVETQGRVWLEDRERSQKTIAIYGDVFVEPMERPRKAPELVRLEQMLRAEQISRQNETEMMRAEFQRKISLFSDLRARADATSNYTRSAAPEGRDKPRAGETPPGEQEGDGLETGAPGAAGTEPGEGADDAGTAEGDPPSGKKAARGRNTGGGEGKRVR